MASKCGNAACKCADASDQGYCSEGCASSAESAVGGACNCGHSACHT